MFNSIILFLLGLVFLIKGGDWFVDGACGIAKRFHVPELLIGATVVSIGTTLPEVMVSATSAMQGLGSMAYGNAIGSIICNTSLIAAITIAIKPCKADKKSLRVPVAFFFFAAAIFAITSYLSGMFSRAIGIIFLVIFVIYIGINVVDAKKAMKAGKNADDEDGEEEGGSLVQNFIFLALAVALFVISLFAEQFAIFSCLMVAGMAVLTFITVAFERKTSLSKNSTLCLISDMVFLVIGAAIIACGADLLVNNGTVIAKELGVPNSVIALTFIALGTSLPELVTAITSLAKGHGALSLGNIIGANLFNIVLVLGTSVTLNPFSIPAEKVIFGMNSSLALEIPLMLAVMGIMTVPPLIKGKLSRWQGVLLLGIYFAFIVLQFAI